MGNFLTSPFSSVTAVGGSAQTIFIVNANSDFLMSVKSWGLTFNGTSSVDAPCLVELVKTSAFGIGTSYVVARRNEISQYSLDATLAADTEGDIDAVLETHYVTPKAGGLTVNYPHKSEFEMFMDGTHYLGIRLTPSNTVSVSGWMAWRVG